MFTMRLVLDRHTLLVLCLCLRSQNYKKKDLSLHVTIDKGSGDKISNNVQAEYDERKQKFMLDRNNKQSVTAYDYLSIT